MARNASISWAVACLSFTTGGLILIWVFNNNGVDADQDHREFSDSMIRIIFGAFSFFLSAFKTFRKCNVWWLSFSWFYLGITTSFMLGVYPTTLIFTESLSKSTVLISFYSFSISVGELSIAVIISIASNKYENFGRVPTAVIGFAIHLLVFTLVLLSTPRYSSLRPNNDGGLLFNPNLYTSLLCGYCMGVADGCWNTIRCCIIPLLLADSRAEGFSISKAFQSLASFVVFFLSPIIDIYAHVAILLLFNILATATFIIASVQDDRKKRRIYGPKISHVSANAIDLCALENKLESC
ncbi:unnamed protein product [Enterobius vermicularis]|uniref:UNC93-like protein 2 n=1 Tax=Enterobius vermicularis TaxID=51028 RepID=A0A0N4UZ85_ENTVE|nr:unnamed protein product [Enterobius vermicularis]